MYLKEKGVKSNGDEEKSLNAKSDLMYLFLLLVQENREIIFFNLQHVNKD